MMDALKSQETKYERLRKIGIGSYVSFYKKINVADRIKK